MIKIFKSYIRSNHKICFNISKRFSIATKEINNKNKIVLNQRDEKVNADIDLASTNEDKNKNVLDYSKLPLANSIPILINENGEVLVYYNTISTAEVLLRAMRYTIPMGGLIFLIKINPFYVTFPVMLPIMVFTLIFHSYGLLNFLRSLQNLVEEIWLDKSGSEIRIVYRNQGYRRLRGVQTEEKLINSALISPSGKQETLKGFKFPEKIPFNEEEVLTFGRFWRKYYVTRKNYYLIAKRAIYANYEMLSHIFHGKSINFSNASAYKLEKTPDEIQKELSEFNYYRIDRVRERIYEVTLKSRSEKL